MIAELPPNEEARLRALVETRLLDTPPEPDFDEIVQLAAALCETPISIMTFVDVHRQWFKSAVGLSVPETPRDVAFCAHAILKPDMFLVPDATQDPRFANNPLVTGELGIRFYAGVPLATTDGYNLGTLCVIDRQPRRLSAMQESALRVLARQVMTQIELRHRVRALQDAISERDRVTFALKQSQVELKRANELLNVLSTTDSLTGLKNRRHFDELLQREFDLALRNEIPLSVLLIDVDHFKDVNDSFGHGVGDDVLRHLSRQLEGLLRRTDLVARHGGEEFAVLLPGTGHAASSLLAESVCTSIALNSLAGLSVTVSIGVVTLDAGMNAPEDLMLLADQGLYQAKALGRNTSARATRPADVPAS